MPNLYFSVAGLFCALLILIVLINKKTDIQKENKFYYVMTITSFFDCLISIIIIYLAYVNYNEITYQLIVVLNKLDFIHFILWPSMLFLYVLYVIYNDVNMEIIKKTKKIVYIIDFIAIIIEFLLPIELYNVDGAMTVLGIGTKFVYALIVIYLICIIFILLINKKKMFQKKFLPILFLIIFIILALFIRSFSPTLIIIPALVVYINLIMFFTIENPDLKLLEEVSKIKSETEKSNEEKSSFIYLVTDEISSFINAVDKKLDEIITNDNIDKNAVNDIKEVKNILVLGRNRLKNTIGVSEEDANNLKNYSTKYNLMNLINGIVVSIKERLKTSKVEFRVNLSDYLPEELYGDSIKIKQIICSLIDNSIKNTKSGYIELVINSIIKNDICRLIISVEDSGSGIDLFKQSEILNNNDDLTDKEISLKDDKVINLKTIKKIVNIIGGTLSINSLNQNGTTITITLDQKIVRKEKSVHEKEFELYQKEQQKILKVAIISNDDKLNKTLKNNLKKYDYKVKDFNVTKDCLDELRSGINYNLIFILEDMEKIDAISFLNKCKKIINFNSKVFVITEKKDINSKKILLDNGFNGVVIKPINKKKLEEILNS